MTTYNVMLVGGPHDGHMTTIHRPEAPAALRVCEKPDMSDGQADESVEVAVYGVSRVDPMPIRILGFGAVYTFQGMRPSAWSLVDFTA